MKFLFVAFLVVPIVEIYFLIAVGSMIGAGLTIFLIILTAVIGATLVRRQGMATYARAQTHLQNGEMPAMEVLEGMFLLFAGALLMTPGFVTDAIGFACLTPPLRRAVIKRMVASGMVKARGSVQPGPAPVGSTDYISQHQNPNRSGGRVIEGEYKDLDK